MGHRIQVLQFSQLLVEVGHGWAKTSMARAKSIARAQMTMGASTRVQREREIEEQARVRRASPIMHLRDSQVYECKASFANYAFASFSILPT